MNDEPPVELTELTAANSVDEIIQRLVETPPRLLSDLERILGSLDFCASPNDGYGDIWRPLLESDQESEHFSRCVSSVSVNYLFDIHHERPYAREDGRAQRNPGLWEYSLSLRVRTVPGRPRRTLRMLLDGVAGSAVPVGASPFGPGLRFGNFYVFEKMGDTLFWYAELPDWAQPRPSDSARRRWLAELAGLLRKDCSHDALVAFFESLPEGVGVRTAGALNGDDYHFALEPTMEALAFCEALGIDEVRAHCGDVHGETWQIVGNGEVSPRMGSWDLEAILREWPKPIKESAETGDGFGAWPVYELRRCKPCHVGPVRIAPRDRR